MPEIVSTFDALQYEAGESNEECGFYTVATLAASNKPGSPPLQTREWVDQVADAEYTRVNGPNTTNNTNGMTYDEQSFFIQKLGFHWQTTEKQYIPGWIALGYPVILAVYMRSVFDVRTGKNPYTWNFGSETTHILFVSGMAGPNYLCRDSSNVAMNGPYPYDASRLEVVNATVFVPPWLPRPTSGIPPVVASPPPPIQGGVDMPITIDIHTPSAAYFFTELNPHQWQCRRNGKIVGYGILNWYKTNGMLPHCGLSSPRLPMTNERAIESYGPKFAHLKGNGIVIQVFEAGALVYDPKHLLDKPIDGGDVYPLKIYDPSSPIVDPLIAQLQAEIAKLQAELQAASGQHLPAPDPLLSHKVALFDQIKLLANS